MLFDLIKVILVLVIAYIIGVFVCKAWNHIPTIGEAASRFQNWLKKMYMELRGNNSEIEFVPDNSLIWRLKNELGAYNHLSPDYTKYKCGWYSAERIPCIMLKLIPKNRENDFSFIKSVMNNIISENLEARGWTNYHVDTFFEQISETDYIVYVCYSTTTESYNAFQRYYNLQTTVEQHKAQGRAKPVVDAKLEKELSGLTDDEVEQ